MSKLPKLVLAVAAACHVVLALSASTGMGGDQNCLHDVLVDAWRERTSGRRWPMQYPPRAAGSKF